MEKIILKTNEKEIDLTPVEKLENRLEQALKQRKTWKDRSHISEILEIQKDSEELNQDQQKYWNNYLIHELVRNYDLFLYAIEDEDNFKEYQNLLNLEKKTQKDKINL